MPWKPLYTAPSPQDRMYFMLWTNSVLNSTCSEATAAGWYCSVGFYSICIMCIFMHHSFAVPKSFSACSLRSLQRNVKEAVIRCSVVGSEALWCGKLLYCTVRVVCCCTTNTQAHGGRSRVAQWHLRRCLFVYLFIYSGQADLLTLSYTSY